MSESIPSIGTAPAPSRRVTTLLRTWHEQRGMAIVAGWSFVAAVVARGANLLALAICARVLGQAPFGQVAVIQGTVGMFAPLAGLGLALTVTKFVAEYRDRHPEKAGRIIALSLCAAAAAGLLMTGALIVLAPLLASQGFGSPGLRKQLVESSGLLFLGAIEAVQGGALTGLEAFAQIAKLSAWGGLLSIPVTVFLAYRYGASGAIAGLTVSLAIACILNALVLLSECRKSGIRLSLRGWRAEKGILFSFSIPAYVSGIVVAPVTWLGSALLVRQSGGFEEMALFSAAERYRFLLIFVPMAVSRIAMPALSRFRAAQNDGAYRSTLRWNLGFGMLTAAIPAVLCAQLSPWLMSLFGPSFREGWPVLSILAISAIPTVLNAQLGAALLSNGWAWPRTAVDLFLAVAFLSAAWVAVPRWNASGLAAAFFLAYSGASLVLWICLQRSHRSVVEGAA